MCTVSLGSDTGGSIRCPSSFCSVVGLKPTYGLVSRYGLISYSNSLEQIGPIGKNVSDVREIFSTISGEDFNDNTTLDNNIYNHNAVNNKSYNNKKIKIGLIKELIDGADIDVSKCIYSSLDVFKNLDFECEETSLQSTEYALASYYTIATAEASSNLARYDNIRYGFELDPEEYEWNVYFSKVRGNFGNEVKRRIIVGTYVLSSGYYGKYYLKAQKARSMIKTELKQLFKKYDLLISSTVPVLPFKIGEKIDDPLMMYLIDLNTFLSNLYGIPAVSIPAGFKDCLQIGIQIMADELQEDKLFNSGELFEKSININSYPDL
jgi:aspartyl-tRNA(Asn)/glutamyl-tRNA(Gln) amidotransferase subunit A